MGTPERKLRYLPGGPPSRPRRPRLVRPDAPPPRRREVASYPRSFGSSLGFHLMVLASLWALALWTPTPTQSAARAPRSVIARLETPREVAPVEQPEPEPEVQVLEPLVEPRLVEASFDPETFVPPEDRVPELLDWLPATGATTRVVEATWKRYPPVVEEVPVAEPDPTPAAFTPPAPIPPTPRVGAVDAPVAVEQPTPEYPRKALRMRWEGTVRLRIQVDAVGRVRQVELVESSGRDVLDEAAIAGFYRWVFRKRLPGDPEQRSFVKSFRFSLD